MERDLPGTLAMVAAIGYTQVEFAGYFGCDPATIVHLLESSGLSAPSAHVTPAELLQHPELSLDTAALTGHQYIVLAWWEAALRNPDGYRQLADLLNRVGTLAQQRGLSLAYHNHDFEFLPGETGTPYDFLLAATDPHAVSYELDLYWAVSSGIDPLQLFADHPGRFPLLHAKDMDSSGQETDIGTGEIDFASLLGALPANSVEHIFVERDEPQLPLASAAQGLNRLQEILGARSGNKKKTGR
ncbi:MAG: sugar phosphate isomerase/epimerase [Halioglobus sp.]